MLLSNSLSRRFCLGALSLTALARCGFTPAISNASPGRGAHYDKFRLPNVNSDETFSLRQSLANYLGQGANAEFQIALNYATSASVLTNSEPSTVTRRRLRANATFTVSRLLDGKQVFSRSYARTASYTTTSDRFAASLSLQNAQRKLASFIAEQFAIELIAVYDQL